nr:hypothetical protein CFP56_65215 [Quercus suber]
MTDDETMADLARLWITYDTSPLKFPRCVRFSACSLSATPRPLHTRQPSALEDLFGSEFLFESALQQGELHFDPALSSSSTPATTTATTSGSSSSLPLAHAGWVDPHPPHVHQQQASLDYLDFAMMESLDAMAGFSDGRFEPFAASTATSKGVAPATQTAHNLAATMFTASPPPSPPGDLTLYGLETPHFPASQASAPVSTMLPERATCSTSRSPHDSGSERSSGSLKRKRERNTEAARRYRQRKVDRVAELEEALAAMTRERDELKLKLARSETEVDVLRGMAKERR